MTTGYEHYDIHKKTKNKTKGIDMAFSNIASSSGSLYPHQTLSHAGNSVT
jgi:ABC-type phosphate/phosphonate transport system substrate-binding protein